MDVQSINEASLKIDSDTGDVTLGKIRASTVKIDTYGEARFSLCTCLEDRYSQLFVHDCFSLSLYLNAGGNATMHSISDSISLWLLASISCICCVDSPYSEEHHNT